MGSNNLNGADWALIISFVLTALALFTVFIVGLRTLWKDEWRGERRRRGRSWCPRLSNAIEQARVQMKIRRFQRDLKTHRRTPRGGDMPGRHHVAHA